MATGHVKGSFALFSQYPPPYHVGSSVVIITHNGISTKPSVGYVVSGPPYNGVPAGSLFMHPGLKGENACLRFSAPVSGYMVTYSATFGPGDKGEMWIAVREKERTVWSRMDGSVNAGPISVTRMTDTVMNAGDVIDFVVWPFSGYDYGNTALDVSVTYACEVCGDGILQGNETCDDANTNNGDGCSSTCKSENPSYGLREFPFSLIVASAVKHGGVHFDACCRHRGRVIVARVDMWAHHERVLPYPGRAESPGRRCYPCEAWVS